MKFTEKNENVAFLIIRIGIGTMMLMHGWAKITQGIGPIEGIFASKGIPTFIAYGSYLGEVLAPILIIIGYRARLAALIFLLTVIVALLTAHAGDIISLNAHGMGGWAAELLGLYIMGGLSLFYTGAGKYAISTKSAWD